jgi:hypothetical protein
MRNLSASAISKIQEQYGTEPITILDIEWAQDSITQYADRDVESINGKILAVSPLDSVITVSNSDDSQQITVTLDDSDGTIKSIMNSQDIHKTSVWVYQFFDGLSLVDRFLLFKGTINSPVSWKESDRSVTFDILSKIEDKEVGFSPEEGQFPFIPRELIGKTWPSCFGTPIDVPCVQINKAITGRTLCGVGIISGKDIHNNATTEGKPPDLREQSARAQYLNNLANIFELASSVSVGHVVPGTGDDPNRNVFSRNEDYINKGRAYRDESNATYRQITETVAQYLQQQRCARLRRTDTIDDAETTGEGCNPIEILGGEDFPRGTITLDINGGLFTGYFLGDGNEFKITSRTHPENEQRVTDQLTNDESIPSGCEPVTPPTKHILWETKVPAGHGNASSTNGSVPGAQGRQGGLYDIFRKDFYLFYNAPERRSTSQNQRAIHFWADAGTTVTMAEDEPIYHVVSIVPGTVLQVKAFKDINGVKTLVNVPDDLWEVENVTYGSISAVQIKLSRSLTTIEDQNWEGDTIYVTFESTIGPNIVDIIKYLIDTYTDLTYDSASFNSVRTKLAPFPANFALLTRKNIVDVLQEIAFQSRCSIRLINDVFYISYLAEEPNSVDTFYVSDIETQSIEVELTSTEDLVTKYTVKWRVSYAQDELNKIILRHNVAKYGIQEEEEEYYIYNQPDIIHKVSTFWLIRKSNTWKRIRFNTFLHKMNVETFDAVTLDLRDYIANSPVKSIVEQAAFNSDNQTINFECWTPVKSGTMVPYSFAWPANVPAEWVFPTDEEVNLGLAGGNNIGENATGELPIGDTSHLDSGDIFVGGINVLFGPQTDRGDSHPSDVGFVAQDIILGTEFAVISASDNPNPYLGLEYEEDIIPPPVEVDVSGVTEIVLERTKVISTRVEGQFNYLSDLISLEEGKPLALHTATLFSGKDQNGSCKRSPYDFKYDPKCALWVAGSAYLAEEDCNPLSDSQAGEKLGECDA